MEPTTADLGAEGPRLALLNGFELAIGGEPVSLQPAMQRLVAFVALQPRHVERDFAAFQLWPDATEDHARANLRSTLWRLRKLPATVLEVTTRRLSVDDSVWIDIRDGLDRQADGVWSRRVASGELLPDWYDEWILVERERLRQVQLRLLEERARTALTDGDPAMAIQAGLAAVAMDPLRESGHRVVIEAHLAEGNPSEAVREFDRYVIDLRDQLGLAPSPAIAALVNGLMAATA
jgi:DNA-binding SARP family transcriptional activator